MNIICSANYIQPRSQIHMLDINFIRENPEKVKKACENKNVQVSVDLVLDLDKEKRGLMTEIETLKAEQNKISRGGAENKEIFAQAKEIKEKGFDKIAALAEELV